MCDMCREMGGECPRCEQERKSKSPAQLQREREANMRNGDKELDRLIRSGRLGAVKRIAARDYGNRGNFSG